MEVQLQNHNMFEGLTRSCAVEDHEGQPTKSEKAVGGNS